MKIIKKILSFFGFGKKEKTGFLIEPPKQEQAVKIDIQRMNAALKGEDYILPSGMSKDEIIKHMSETSRKQQPVKLTKIPRVNSSGSRYPSSSTIRVASPSYSYNKEDNSNNDMINGAVVGYMVGSAMSSSLAPSPSPSSYEDCNRSSWTSSSSSSDSSCSSSDYSSSDSGSSSSSDW